MGDVEIERLANQDVRAAVGFAAGGQALILKFIFGDAPIRHVKASARGRTYDVAAGGIGEIHALNRNEVRRSRSGDAIGGSSDPRTSLVSVDSEITEGDAIGGESQNRAASRGVLAFEGCAIASSPPQPEA
jgi:hypothetical protein